ncbi:MAG: hypothetical protein K1W00_11060 [Lachnospiraceae bacterium]
MNDKIKYIPAILSLTAGLIASIIAITSNYDTLHIMIIILVALVAFYAAGVIVRLIFEKNFVIRVEEEADGEDNTQSSEDEEKEEIPEGEQTEGDSPDAE